MKQQFFLRQLSLIVVSLFLLGVLFSSCSSSRKQASTGKKGKANAVANTTKTSSKTSVKSDKIMLESYANQMGVSVSKLQSPKLYALIDQWIGAPYRYAGNTQKGVDCSGLVVQIYRQFTDKTIPRSSSALAKEVVSKPVNKLKEGDLVFFNYDGKNSHVGIYLQNGWFVHASTIKGVVLSDMNSTYYSKRFSKGGPLKIGNLLDL